jgi:superfamily II RNA helicase
LQLWPAAALFLWASGYSWPELLGFVEIEEGDMAMLILRTADHLRQVANLDKSHPALAERARQALPLIVREPVSLYG